MNVFPIIKCVGVSCNLRCSYCYHTEENQSVSSHIYIPYNTIERLISQVIDINNGFCHCLWHGGEPLLAGIDFFKHVVSIQQKFIARGKRITNSIQTNGTLINSHWAKFFKANNFHIGISIDGPDHMHDQYRKYTKGNESFKNTMRGIKMCQKYGCEFGVIAAVTDYNVQFPEELYSFFISNGIKNISLNPVYEIDGSGKLYPYSVSDVSFGNFLTAIFDMWIADDNPDISIRQFTDPLTKMCGGDVSTCIFSGRCATFLEVYPDGIIKPCHGFRTEILGNINTHTFQEIFSDRPYQTLLGITKTLPTNCLSCEWLPICNGGCCDHRSTPYNLLDSNSYVFCDSRRKIFSLLRKFVSNHGV